MGLSSKKPLPKQKSKRVVTEGGGGREGYKGIGKRMIRVSVTNGERNTRSTKMPTTGTLPLWLKAES